MPVSELLPLPVQYVRMVASGIVYPHPCLVFLLRAEGLSSTVRYARVYDGFSTSDPLISQLSASLGNPDTVFLTQPLSIHAGLYVALESDKVAALCAFMPLPES